MLKDIQVWQQQGIKAEHGTLMIKDLHVIKVWQQTSKNKLFLPLSYQMVKQEKWTTSLEVQMNKLIVLFQQIDNPSMYKIL